MKTMRLAALGLLLGLLLLNPPTGAARRTADPVALVYALAGEATVSLPAAEPRPLRLFDRLPAGADITAGPGCRLELAFANGLRYELRQGARARLGRTDLTSRSGSVHPLPTVPPLPRLAAAAAGEAGPEAGAVRIRAETVDGLYPHGGAAALAGAATLRFVPVSGAGTYQVEVQDRQGEVVFATRTADSEVAVPAGILRPGRRYGWSVRTVERVGPVAHGKADFVTLAERDSEAREALRAALAREGDGAAWALLAAVDESLGLLVEARDGLLAAAAGPPVRCPYTAPGLVVEAVPPESPGFRAGFLPGDRLMSWCRTGSGEGRCVVRGDFRTPFDWLDVQMEEMYRGGVVIEGMRGSAIHRWTLLPTVQGLTVAPLLRGALADIDRSSREREEAGEPAAAAEQLERAAALADEIPCADTALWLRNRAAQLGAEARQWPAVDAGYRLALAKAQELAATRAEVHLLMGWSETLLLRGDLPQAGQQLARALALEAKDRPEGAGVVSLLLRLGNVAERQDDIKEADRLYRRAHELILRVAPGSGGEAAAATNLAITTGWAGDLAQAERYAARALEIREKLAPSGEAVVPSLVNHGMLLTARGDFAGAEAAFLRAKGILEKLQPESPAMVTVLDNLGGIAWLRHDLDAAESLFQRELALAEKLDPGGSLALASLISLGEVALERRQEEEVEAVWQRALALSEKLHPRGPRHAMCLRGLAAAARLQGRDAEAERLLRQALAIRQEIAVAADPDVHLDLGLLLLDQGKAAEAEAHFRAALPRPEAFQALGRLQAQRGQADEAAASYFAAIAALDTQRQRLGGPQESRWLYGSRLGDLYFEAAEHQLGLARPQEAWQLVERGRAQGFQELLTQRDLRFAGELPVELYAERRRLAADYDRVQTALAGWVPEQGPGELGRLEGRLRDLRLDQAQVQEQIRRSAPRLEALDRPAFLDLAAARSALDRGTVLLTYAVGESRSFLFVVEAEGTPGPGLSFFPLAVGRADLEREIEAFRGMLGRPETLLPAVRQRGKHLYDLLVRPAEPVLAKADRWLVSPDGPLHALPFAALVAGDRYLAEDRPIHAVASAAVYKEIKATRPEKPPAAPMELLAVGDPLYPAQLDPPTETAADPQVQTALRRGFRLEPLPATRHEVEAISRLFPQARTLLGSDATEEAVKALAPRAWRLHLACHGLLDERFPLNSGLAFSIPEQPEGGRDNGLLQAWEIFEGLRLDADLVTLSACDSGLGEEMGGEGMVGLVRAFQFAGARSVLASLWSVADVSTAQLMERFYTYLRQGRTKDEALQAAQLDLIRSAEAGLSHPYHWAAFALHGDWR
jgi:CHAT domain-containing protein/tetratricopeptide (TPR) repeat protein